MENTNTENTNTVVEQIRVTPKISLLNKYVQKVKKVSINEIHPVYAAGEDGLELQAFNISIEGPAQHMSYFHRLLERANLRVS